MRRATPIKRAITFNLAYFYPRSPCGERPTPTCGAQQPRYFYPRSPCGERPALVMRCKAPTRFLSTLSLRRATWHGVILKEVRFYFYPRSPCGERQTRPAQPSTTYTFLSTLSLRRATRRGSTRTEGLCHFYPRSPCGERRPALPGLRLQDQISIHALLAESDVGQLLDLLFKVDFYPRSPCGERPAFGQTESPNA